METGISDLTYFQFFLLPASNFFLLSAFSCSLATVPGARCSAVWLFGKLSKNSWQRGCCSTVTLLLEYLKTYDFCFTGYFLKFFRAGLSCHCFWMFNSKAVEHWFLTEYLFRIFQKITSETPLSESIFSKVLPDVHRGIFLRHFQIGLV